MDFRVMAGLLLFPMALSAQNAVNGIHGGYAGSDLWFARMRQGAANQALLKSLGGRGMQNVPAGYAEFAGFLEFPGGNPFPAGRLPDLRIRCTDAAADGVERAPHVDEAGAFYTVLKRGLSYEVCWMYYFGSKEAFGRVDVPRDAASPLRRTITYRAPGAAPVSAPQPAMDLAEADRFDLSGFPTTPGTFEEQQILEAIKDASNPALKADAHGRLARYYGAKGDAARAGKESAKAMYWKKRI